MTTTLTDAQLERLGYKPGQFDEVRKQIARNRLARMRRSDDSDPTDTTDEYASERLGAAELGVGRFHDGRGL